VAIYGSTSSTTLSPEMDKKENLIQVKFNFSTSKPKSILIVDDELVIRNANHKLIYSYLVSIKKENEYNIIKAVDGIEALYFYYLSLYEGRPIEVIFSDQTMNYMDGTVLARLINKELTKFNKKCDFYLVTAYENHDSDIVKKVIQKPLTKNKLKSIIF